MKDLFERAREGDITILEDPNCSKIKGIEGRTPLHYLAEIGKIEVLNHPDIAIVKNKYGRTPLHILADREKVKASDLKKLFPWYLRNREGKVSKEEITEILNTPNSIQYILSED